MFYKCKAAIHAICSIILISIFSMPLAQDAVSYDDPLSVNRLLPVEGSGQTYVDGIDSGQALVDYDIIDGKMIMEGDIILGDAGLNFDPHGPQNAIVRDQRYRWPNGVMPYVFHSTLSFSTRGTMRDAFRLLESKTNVRFVERTEFNSALYPDYVSVVKSNGCFSSVGRTLFSSVQTLSMGAGCDNIFIGVHEIGHALGLWHEQSRNDRDEYVKINYENIESGRAGNFNKYSLDNVLSVTPYDYRSVMHYSAKAFSTNGLPTIETINPVGASIGFRDSLSSSDIKDINFMYPDQPVEVIVDNSDANSVVKTGYWNSSANEAYPPQNPYGEESEFTDNPNSTFTWNFIVPETGLYAVQVYSVYGLNNTTTAKYTIEWPGGSDETIVDHKLRKDRTLFSANFIAGDQVRLTLSSGGTGTLRADMAKLLKIGDFTVTPDRSIVDNLDVDSISKLGNWYKSGAAEPHEEDSEFSSDSDASFTWNLVVPETDYYQVQAYWTYWGNRTGAARYTVQTPLGVETVVLDQKENASTWSTLFDGDFTAGDEITVTVTNDSYGTLSADATRLLKTEPPTSNLSIVDNLDIDSISKQGSWYKSSAADPYGEDSEFSMEGDASFTWNLVVPETDDYKIQTYWTYWGNRTSDATYTIQTPLGTTTKVVDQKDNAATWFTLLEGNFTAGDQITISVFNGSGEGSLSADASRLLSAELPIVAVTVDNQDDSVTRSGFWTESGGANPFSGQSEYSFIGTFNWEALLPDTGLYRVDAYWTEFANRTDAASYEIQHANGTDTVVVNQKTEGGQWIELGQYDFSAGPANILLSNSVGVGTLSADAVRFTPLP